MSDRPNSPILEINYKRLEGTACYAPYVQIAVSNPYQDEDVSVLHELRVDTGADITIIPEKGMKVLRPILLGGPVRLCLNPDGSVTRHRTHRLKISLLDSDAQEHSFRPKRGILISERRLHGLLGMDVLRRLDIRMHNEKLYIHYPETGGAQ